MKSQIPRITKQRHCVLSWLAKFPGSSRADIDRTCRTARRGHAWMYALVARAVDAGLIERAPEALRDCPPQAEPLQVSELGWKALQRARGHE